MKKQLDILKIRPSHPPLTDHPNNSWPEIQFRRSLKIFFSFLLPPLTWGQIFFLASSSGKSSLNSLFLLRDTNSHTLQNSIRKLHFNYTINFYLVPNLILMQLKSTRFMVHNYTLVLGLFRPTHLQEDCFVTFRHSRLIRFSTLSTPLYKKSQVPVSLWIRL